MGIEGYSLGSNLEHSRALQRQLEAQQRYTWTGWTGVENDPLQPTGRELAILKKESEALAPSTVEVWTEAKSDSAPPKRIKQVAPKTANVWLHIGLAAFFAALCALVEYFATR